MILEIPEKYIEASYEKPTKRMMAQDKSIVDESFEFVKQERSEGNIVVTNSIRSSVLCSVSKKNLRKMMKAKKYTLYEILYNLPSRLYLDIEYPTEKEKNRDTIKAVMKAFTDVLKDETIYVFDSSRKCKANCSTPCKHPYYNSYRILFPNVIFKDMGSMKKYVSSFKDYVYGKGYLKVPTDKNNCCFDLSVYKETGKKMQKMRLPYVLKEGDPKTLAKASKKLSTCNSFSKYKCTYGVDPNTKQTDIKTISFKVKKKKSVKGRKLPNILKRTTTFSKKTKSTKSKVVKKQPINVEKAQPKQEEQPERRKSMMNLTIEQISKILNNLAPSYYNQRDKWRNVLWCLASIVDKYKKDKKDNKDIEAIYKLADDFSKKWSKYTDNKETRSIMEQYDPDMKNALTVNSLYHYLFTQDPNLARTIVGRKTKDYYNYTYYKFLKDWANKVVTPEKEKNLMADVRQILFYIQEESIYYVRYGNTFKEKKEYDIANDLKHYKVKYIYENDGCQTKKEKSLWYIINKHRLSFSYTEKVYRPYTIEDPYKYDEKVFNSYIKFKSADIITKETFDMEKIKPLLHHIKYVLCKDDEEMYNFFILWLAYLTQYPERKTEVANVIHGNPGSGKSIFSNFLVNKYLGNHLAVSTPDMDIVTGNFNGIIDNMIFVNFEETAELKSRGSRNNKWETMKSFIKDPLIVLKVKNKTARQHKNYLNFFFVTNNINSVMLTNQDRRYNIVSTRDKQSQEYYTNLVNNLKDVNAQHLYYYLSTMNLENKKPANLIPKTSIRDDAIASSLKPEIAYVAKFLLKNPDSKHVQPNRLYTGYEKWCKNSQNIDSKYILIKKNFMKNIKQILGKTVPRKILGKSVRVFNLTNSKNKMETYTGISLETISESW